MPTPNALINNRYLVKRRIGASAAYEAIDLHIRALVVLKQAITGAPIASSAVTDEAFERAARPLWGLRHPNLPIVRDYFVERRGAFLVMNLVPGDDLAALLKRNGPFSVKQVQRWAGQLLDALDYIHTLQPPVIHGDINPQNLKLAPRDQIVLLGFGLPPGAVRGTSASGENAESARFLSPEQVQGAAAGERSDLFSLAATLYYLLTGVPPVPAEERANTLAHSQPDPLPPPHTLNLLAYPALSAVLMQALALDPAGRPESTAAMRVALEQAYEADLLTSPPTDQAPDVETTREQAPPAPSRPRWRRWVPAIAAVLFVALLGLLALQRGVFANSPIAGQPTPQPSIERPTIVATSLPAVPTGAPTAVIPVAIATATTLRETRPPERGSPTVSPPTATPVLQVAGVEPQQAFIGALPLMLTVRGVGLDQVRTARLIADGRSPIDAAIQAASADQLTLTIAALPQPLNGEAVYQIELNGSTLASSPITLRDFLERRVVQGVLSQYTYTSRVAVGSGGYTRMRVEPKADSQAVGQLRNGDEVEVLRADVAGWYQVRIRTSGDAAQTGMTGWIERWLVDNQGVPAAPTPLVFTGRVYDTPTDAAVPCGASFESSIYGSVESTSGGGIAGARLQITSADGRNTFNVTTRRGGVYNLPGLGCTTWTVRLLSVPNAPNGIRASPVTVRNLNGGRFTAAEVRFKMQR